MTTNATLQVSVRLDDAHRAMVDAIGGAISTPMLPPPTLADIIRAAIRDTHGRLAMEPMRDPMAVHRAATAS